MKVLYFTNKPVFPLIDGGCVAMYQFLKGLLEMNCEIDHICISTHKHPFKATNYPKKIKEKISPVTFKIDTRIRPYKALQYLIKNGSYNVSRFHSKRIEDRIEKISQDKEYDFIILESVFLGPYIECFRKFSKAKIVIRSHNVEFKLWEKLARTQTSFPKRKYFEKLAKDLKKDELNYLNEADGIMSISEADLNNFKENKVRTKITSIPVIVDAKPKNSNYNNNTFFHLGAMNWEPNIQAVHELVNHIFPEIKKERPDAHLFIAGSNMPSSITSDLEKGIEVLGFVEDLDCFMVNAGILLSPIKAGSGVRIKLLESMSFGVPILTTPQGMEGIEGKHNTHFKIVKSNEAFIKEAIRLYDDIETRKTLGLNAKKMIVENYSLNAIKTKTFGFLQSL